MPTVLLCHCDGTNGSAVFTDSSPLAHTLTTYGSTVVSTANPKFGTGAGDYTGGGAGRGLVSSVPADFNLGAGQFTVEGWLYMTSAPGTFPFLSKRSTGTVSWYFGWTGATSYGFYYSTDGSNWATPILATYTIPLNTWVHVAADRDASNTLRVYANGVVVASGTAAATIIGTTDSCGIGCDSTVTNYLNNGYIDEVRVTTGLARYGGAFTPPTAPFALDTTWNPSDKSAGITLSGGNLIATGNAAAISGVRAVDKQTSGKWYFEYTCNTFTNNSDGVGIISGVFPLTSIANTTSGIVGNCVVNRISGSIIIDGSTGGNPSLGAITSGSLICIAVDLTARLVWMRLGSGGNWNNSASANPATGAGGLAIPNLGVGIPAYPAMAVAATSDQVTANFGDSAFTGTVPSGFTSGWPSGVTSPTNELLTQVAVEQWARTIPPQMQLTQAAIEQWGTVVTVSTQAQVTQVAMEQWASVALASAVAQARVMVMA